MFHCLVMIAYLLIAAIASFSTGSCPYICKCVNKEMDCSHRNLASVPQEFGSYYETFNLSYNSINILDKWSFKNTLNLKEIYLPYNKIRFIQKETFYKLNNLHVLVLSDNQIENIFVNTFKNNSRLFYLDLHNNSDLLVPRTEHFLDIPSLIWLSLSNCNISSISEKTFASMVNLKYLDISKNKLKTVDPAVFEFLPHLQQLEVAGNDLVCNCSIERVTYIIRTMKVCVVGRTCYSNDTAFPTDWDDLHLECSITSSINQTIEKYTSVNNIQTTANCSKDRDFSNILKIGNHGEEIVNDVTLNLKTNDNKIGNHGEEIVNDVILNPETNDNETGRHGEVIVNDVILNPETNDNKTGRHGEVTVNDVILNPETNDNKFGNHSEVIVNDVILNLETNDNTTFINKTSTTAINLTSLATYATEHQIITIPAPNITENAGSVFLSGSFVFPITLFGFCACMTAIICILYRKSVRKAQTTRDIELIAKVATAVFRKEVGHGNETSRYSATPSLARSAGEYNDHSLDEINQMYLENNRPPSSEGSYLVPRECENKTSTEAKQYFDKHRNPTRTLNIGLLHFHELQLHLQNNTSPNSTPLLSYNSSSVSYCSDYHIYEEID